MSESQEWALACGGDAAAFGRVFDLHYARVLRHAARVIDDRHEAEDAVATAFLELWRRRREVRLVEGLPLPWLLVTATRCAQNVRRSSWRYRRLLARLPREEVANGGSSADAGRRGSPSRPSRTGFVLACSRTANWWPW